MILFLFVGFLGLAVVVFCFIGLIIACFRRSWRIAKISVLIAVGAVGGVMLLTYLIFRPYDPKSESELKNAYSDDFGVLPPPGITVLKARQIIINDSGGQWMLLKASPAEIEDVISKGFIKSKNDYRDFDGNPGANVPGWWKPPSERLEFYENLSWTKEGGWSWSQAHIGVDRGAGMIWFVADKMD